MDRRSFLKSLAASAVAAGATPALAGIIEKQEPLLISTLKHVDSTQVIQHPNGWWHVIVKGRGYSGGFGEAWLSGDEDVKFSCFIKPVSGSVKIGDLIVEAEDDSETAAYEYIWPQLEIYKPKTSEYIGTSNYIPWSEGGQ